MPEAREYHTQQVHYLRKEITFADDGNEIVVGRLPANALVVRAYAYVTTLFDGSTGDLIIIGNEADPNEYATALDASAVGLLEDRTTLDAAADLQSATDTDVTCQYDDATGDAAAGVATIVVEYIPDNDG